MPYEEVTKKTLEELRDKIRAKIPNNTGDAASSLEIDGNKLLGNDYIYYLDKGSKPWANPDKYKSLGYVLGLSGWAEKKGINPYAAAYGIAHNGSSIFRHPEKGIQLDSLVNETIENLYETIKEQAVIEAKTFLKI